jgi:lysophospholipase L1-like esterase
MMRRCFSIAVLAFAFSLALAGVFVGQTWAQVHAAKLRAASNPQQPMSKELRESTREVAAIHSAVSATSARFPARRHPFGASAFAASPFGASPLATAPSSLSSLLSGIASSAGGKSSAPTIVHSPARLRKLLGAKKAARALANADMVINVTVEDVDPIIVSQVLNTTWPQQVGAGPIDQELLNTINKNKNEYGDNGLTPSDLPGTTITTSPDTSQVSSTNITLDVPGGDYTTQGSAWLSGTAATAISAVTYWVAEIGCLAAFAAPTGPLAVGICGAIANGLSTFVWFIMGRGFSCGWTTTCFGNPTFLGVTFASTAIALISGGLGYGFAMAVGPLRKSTIWLAGKLRTAITAALTWLSNFVTVQIPAWPTAIYNFVVSFGNGVALAWRTAVATARGGGPPVPITNIPLRPMALGDSITYGDKSSDGAGYRCALQSYLDQGGASYSFVGAVSAGSCTDEVFPNGGTFQPQNEGHNGWTISQIQALEHCAVTGNKPNVVFLDIGTNDLRVGGDPGAAATNEENLINSIFADSSGVTIVVGGLIPTGTYASNMSSYNILVSSWISQHPSGANGVGHVIYADMQPVKSYDLADGLHPNDGGYDKMAFPWLGALQTASDNGWIKAASAASGTCGGLSGGAPNWFPQGQFASGFGAQLTPPSQPGGKKWAFWNSVKFADINGDGKADFLIVNNDGSVDAWLNASAPGQVTPIWNSVGRIATGVGLPGTSVRFADINGDGKADYVILDPSNGSLTVWLNAGPGCGANYCWTSKGTVAPGVGANPAYVQLADVNGDGKADYLVVNTDSSVNWWQNGGASSTSPSGWAWNPSGVLAPGVGVPGTSVRFADINGDGKADYNVIGTTTGSVTSWFNAGPGCGSNYCWNPQGQLASGALVSADAVVFANITGSGRADYLVLDLQSGTTNVQMFQNGGWNAAGNYWAWNNRGYVSQTRPGRVIYADINGDKRADFLYLSNNGTLFAWLNAGFNGSIWIWTYLGRIAPGVGISGNYVQFADINGDGKADYLIVDPDTGVVTAYLNAGPGCGGDYCWTNLGVIATGVGALGFQVEFADINGDGKADYLVLGVGNGSVTAWFNGGPGCGGYCWIPKGTIAPGVGDFWSRIRFATLYGSGRADYLDVHDDSSVNGYQNGGASTSSPSGWAWPPQGIIASGVGAPGSQITFADINGDGLADYLNVNPDTGSTYAWTNTVVH